MFVRAQPVWLPAESDLRHQSLDLLADRPDGPAILRIAASSVFRAWVDDELFAYGPARCAHGHFRTEEWPIPAGRKLRIQTVSYGANGYIVATSPGFVAAEVLVNGKPTLWTSPTGGGFQAFRDQTRVRKTVRYSFQRPWSEAYRYDAETREVPTTLVTATAGPWHPRRSPLPELHIKPATAWIAGGVRSPKANPALRKDRAITQIGPTLGGYPEAELEVASSLELQTYESRHRREDLPPTPRSVAQGNSIVGDLGVNLSGFLRLDLQAAEPSTVYLLWDEFAQPDGRVDFLRLDCANAIRLDLPAGSFRFESAEPYTMKAVEVFCAKGSVEVSNLAVREVCGPYFELAQFACSNPRLNQVFDAAVETLRQNAVDIFMDCPSRERAGWLADSFFTARAAHLLAGSTAIEDDFLENYALADNVPGVPAGMVPMCYPSDHPDGNFIPQWALWLLLQLAEYPKRGGNPDILRLLRPKVDAILAWFARYENSDGLLESLPGWNFIEWSKANEWVQAIHYPTNMLYSAALLAVDELYGGHSLSAKADRLRKAIHAQSYDGTYFVDNATRQDGGVRATGNRSEVCQYFAFRFGGATRETFPDLWERLVTEFGPRRHKTGKHPDIAFANALIGNVLRIELLRAAGHNDLVCDEVASWMGAMAETTGTLWEHDGPYASCCHGFASHAVVWLADVALGLQPTGPKSVRAERPSSRLDWAKGKFPRANGWIEVSWDQGAYRVALPDGTTRTR